MAQARASRLLRDNSLAVWAATMGYFGFVFKN